MPPQTQTPDPYAPFQKPKQTSPGTPPPTPPFPGFPPGQDPYAPFQRTGGTSPSDYASAGTVPPRRQTWGEWLASYAPSTESVLIGGGSAIGGALGAGGGALFGFGLGGAPGAILGAGEGAAAGEGLYQLGQKYAPRSIRERFFPGQAPRSLAESASRFPEPIITGTMQEIPGALATEWLPGYLAKSAMKAGARSVSPVTSEQIAASRKAMETVITELPRARNLTSLTGQLEMIVNKEGPAVDALYASIPPGTTIPGSSQRIIAGLRKLQDQFLEDAGVAGMKQPVPHLEDVARGYDDMIRNFQGGDQPLLNLRKRRGAWDKLVGWWKRTPPKPGEEALLEQTANLVREEINTAFPQIGRQNARFSAYKDLFDIASGAEPAAWLGGKPIPPSLLGSLTQEAMTGRAMSAFTKGHAATYGAGFIKTWWRTASAPALAKFADFLGNGDVQNAIRVILARPGIDFENLIYPTLPKNRAEAFQMLGQNPASPLPRVSQAPPTTPQFSASARIAAPPPAPASAPAPTAAPAPTLTPRDRAQAPPPPILTGNDAVLNLGQAISMAEGFNVPGALPQRQNNPGNLRPPGGGPIRNFNSPEEGWRALFAQVQSMFDGTSRIYHPQMTIREMAQHYTATRPEDWAKNVAGALGVTPETTLAELANIYR